MNDQERIKAETKKVWDEIVARAEASPEGFLAAELEACGKGYAPPHFDQTGLCHSCGKMRLHPYKTHSGDLQDCPWCQSGWSAIEKGLGV